MYLGNVSSDIGLSCTILFLVSWISRHPHLYMYVLVFFPMIFNTMSSFVPECLLLLTTTCACVFSRISDTSSSVDFRLMKDSTPQKEAVLTWLHHLLNTESSLLEQEKVFIWDIILWSVFIWCWNKRNCSVISSFYMYMWLICGSSVFSPGHYNAVFCSAMISKHGAISI